MVNFAFYLLLAVSAGLITTAGVVAFRSRTSALVILAFAFAAGVGAGICALMALNRTLPPKAYRAVRQAATEDVEVDAAVDWVLTDNVLTPSEYGQVAQTYREKTGRELNDLAK